MHQSSAQIRRDAVVRLILEGQGASQQELVEALREVGITVTQATLSRDLREMGAQKGPGGYTVPGAGQDPLIRALRTCLTGAVAAQNLVVLKTPPGGASALAVALDSAEHRDIVGTIAGDDTIMVITKTSKVAAALATSFGQHASQCP